MTAPPPRAPLRLWPAADCRRCEREAMEREPDPLRAAMMRRFIVCPTCGNKRCPKASDHRLACTGSNEPGQPGSDYE